MLFDLGPHLIDQALTLFGAPKTVFATVRQHRDHAHAPDYVHLLLGYGDKEVVLHATALSALEPPRFSVHGTRGSYVKNGLDTQEDQLKAGLRPGDAAFGKNPPGLLREVDGDHDLRQEFATRDGAYADYYRSLAASILDKKPFPVSAQDAVDVMTIIELAMQSDAEGRRVDVRAGRVRGCAPGAHPNRTPSLSRLPNWFDKRQFGRVNSAARVGRARGRWFSRAAPPKGHTHKLSGKRTGRVEEIARFEAVSSHSGERHGFDIGNTSASAHRRGARRIVCTQSPRNLSGTEDRGVMLRSATRFELCMLCLRLRQNWSNTQPEKPKPQAKSPHGLFCFCEPRPR